MLRSPAHPYIFLSTEQRKRCEHWLDELEDNGVAGAARIDRMRESIQTGKVRSLDLYKLERAGENKGVAAFRP